MNSLDLNLNLMVQYFRIVFSSTYFSYKQNTNLLIQEAIGLLRQKIIVCNQILIKLKYY